MRSDRFARALLRLYPRAWRERYGEELVALMEEQRPSFRVFVDLVCGAIGERWRVATNWDAVPFGLRSTLEFAFVVVASWQLSKASSQVAWQLAFLTQAAVAHTGHTAREALPLIDDVAVLGSGLLMALSLLRAWRGNFPFSAPARPLQAHGVVFVYAGLFASFALALYSDLIGTNMDPWTSSVEWLRPPPMLGPLFMLHQGWRRTRHPERRFQVW